MFYGRGVFLDFLTDGPWLIKLQGRLCQIESMTLLSCLITKIKIFLTIIMIENINKIYL